MTSNRLILWTRRAAAALLLSLAVWADPAPRQLGKLVPFHGTVEGIVTISATGDLEVPRAEIVSPRLGRSTQVYEFLTITQDERDGQIWLRAEGVASSAAENGDVVRIEFLLEGSLTGTEIVPYAGWYKVLPGGTGRFAYSTSTSTSNLGQGRLAGMASITVDPDTGTTTFAFRHRFAGTLRLEFPRRR